MKLSDINKLVEARMKVDAAIKVQEAELVEKLAPYKLKRAQIEEALGTAINKSGGKGCSKSVKVGDVNCYASEIADYKLDPAERDALCEWVLDPFFELFEMDKDHASITDIKDRMNIFANAIDKKTVKAYRLETGGKEDKDGKVTGGDIPAGVNYKLVKKVNFRKAS